ncbi:hypothetical protein FQR65_LT14995 [Abscondita terminalis]|nr:hypothetical protein FQR65_LT14995 [Abscondita terminalis]
MYKGLTKAWSKGVAILFATGAVSGTMLSFELGLLWPEFMVALLALYSGCLFHLEGTAFFIEAQLDLGFFFTAGIKFINGFIGFVDWLVGISGLASGILIPIAAMFNDAWFPQALTYDVASFLCHSFTVAGVHAYLIMKKKNVEFHTKPSVVAVGFALNRRFWSTNKRGYRLQVCYPKEQPIKLAAMEAHFDTERGAPFVLGGIPDMKSKTVKYAIKIPKVLSFLAKGDFNAEVKGLKSFPEDEWPPEWLNKNWLLKTFLIATPFGYIALEAGWTVTEVGRQPLDYLWR